MKTLQRQEEELGYRDRYQGKVAKEILVLTWVRVEPMSRRIEEGGSPPRYSLYFTAHRFSHSWKIR